MGRYNLGRVKLPAFSFQTGDGRVETTKTIDDLEANVNRHAGSYHLDYRENGIRLRPTILKVLDDAGRRGITAANMSSKDITDAIGIVERRLNASKHGDIVLTDAETKKKKGRNAKVPILDCISL